MPDLLTERIIGAGIEVHRNLGPGLLESAYRECLLLELRMRGLEAEKERLIPLEYKGVTVDCSYRADLIVENTVLLELKTVDALMPVHKAQLLTYLKLTGLKTGLLMNFNVPVLKNGIERMVL